MRTSSRTFGAYEFSGLFCLTHEVLHYSNGCRARNLNLTVHNKLFFRHRQDGRVVDVPVLWHRKNDLISRVGQIYTACQRLDATATLHCVPRRIKLCQLVTSENVQR